MKPVLKMAIAAVIGATGASAVSAQDAELGKEQFEQRCAVCHGIEGTGDGAVGELFAQKPKNLQLLAKDNGGVFPFIETYQAIDGRRDIAAHGNTEMPIWGDYLMVEAIEDRSINPKDARMIVEGRILSLVYYIQSIQNQ